MNILLSNDDGFYADGLWALAEALKEVATVTVVAPDRDQSGTGTSVTFLKPLRYGKTRSPVKGVNAYRVEGTPGDCVIMALRTIVQDKIDLVISGINTGSNLGHDFFMSGTVGAAIQGYFYGTPAVALSVAAFSDVNYEVTAEVGRLLALAYQQGMVKDKTLLNVNVPNLEKRKITGIQVTGLGERSYIDKIEKGHDGKRDYYWIVHGIPEWSVIPGTDVWALEQNMISITPFPDRNINLDKLVSFFNSELLGKPSGTKSK
jgi:5'-nucleotidase